ncbi:hypothetical protein [Bowmanella yangjiangensis]|uniref:Uncharacterized protein n=1 Tax=Bowmanella yangjiangensis TaxID=2811230 RepID=A0ABS3CMC9_9ALTE|nr:hypothetical protein [Bowmanella yangjiangensis]MBN7818263.1 hypothetical protein [Bowmanella yangjiangensis]
MKLLTCLILIATLMVGTHVPSQGDALVSAQSHHMQMQHDCCDDGEHLASMDRQDKVCGDECGQSDCATHCVSHGGLLAGLVSSPPLATQERLNLIPAELRRLPSNLFRPPNA